MDLSWVDDAKVSNPYTSNSSSPTSMSFPSHSSRPTSPSLLPFRYTGGNIASAWSSGESRDLAGIPEARSRRVSAASRGKESKGKERATGKDLLENAFSGPSSSSGHVAKDADSFAPSRYDASASPSLHASHASVSSFTAGPSTSSRRQRGSLLVVASDALGFKFGRRRNSVVRQPPPMPIILPDVIEISAPRRDEEAEERERFRNEAAQALGLGPALLQSEAMSVQETLEEEDEEEEDGLSGDTQEAAEMRYSEPAYNVTTKSLQASSQVSIQNPPPSPFLARHRSGSVAGHHHNRSNSTVAVPMPTFPSTPSALLPYTQASSSLLKYHPPQSLRIFALSKQWKTRCMVLSTPTTIVTRNSGPALSYLHLFKTTGSEDKELERLEINEESVVFVAEEEVAGRRHVIKVGGVDVGALKKELNQEEGGRTMWFLQITDQGEAQKWISAIKNAILGQRSMRAGLGLPASSLGAVEPRGDMDVMLSMRAQGIISSPIRDKFNLQEFASNTTPRSPTASQAGFTTKPSSASSHSVRSQKTLPKTSSSGAVSALKGLFNASMRPRSASQSSTIDSGRSHREAPEESSFTTMGNNLLGLLRSNTNVSDGHISQPALPRPSTAPSHNLPFGASAVSVAQRLDRKIVVDRQPIHTERNGTQIIADKATRVKSMSDTFALQPAPRKRWTSTGPSPSIASVTSEDSHVYSQSIGNRSESRVSSYGRTDSESPPSPSAMFRGFTFGTPEQKPRAPSLTSVSTLASGEYATGPERLSVERSSSSTKRSSKRWSRQLPQRLTPPSGPPPAVPSSQGSIRHMPHPYSGERERPQSRASSTRSMASGKSVVSSLPSFSNRASASSALSVNTAGTSHSHAANGGTPPRPSAVHRASMPPPPRPAPTSALPPAPNDATPKATTPPATKTSFRDSMTHRGFRLSLMAPKPPPSTVLPPRPDEVQFRTHRRSTSSSRNNGDLPSIPASPDLSKPLADLAESPFPPPLRPLPPTPHGAAPSPTPSRHTSLKQRLRILSAPSPSSPSFVESSTSSTSRPTTAASTTSPYTPSTFFSSSPATTPVGEKLTYFPNEPSFLQLYSPLTPFHTPKITVDALPPPSPETYPELTSLSPPPRRSSKQISFVEKETLSSDSSAAQDDRASRPSTSESKEAKSLQEPPSRPFSLSHHGSAISLGIVSM